MSEIEDGIRDSTLLRILQGVTVATETSSEEVKPIVTWITNLCARADVHASEFSRKGFHVSDGTCTASLQNWEDAIAIDAGQVLVDGRLQQIWNLVLGISFLYEHHCSADPLNGDNGLVLDLRRLWKLFYGALTMKSQERPLCTTSRSAQGCLSVPLCNLIDESHANFIFCLHVWLPDDDRVNQPSFIQAHQSFAQSWVLAGQATYNAYGTHRCSDPSTATHARDKVEWNELHEGDSTHKTDQTSSTFLSTVQPVSAIPGHSRKTNSEISPSMSYRVPAAEVHSIAVPSDTFYATLFLLDSRRGSASGASVLGIENRKAVLQPPDPAELSPMMLANMVDDIRIWEEYIKQGRMMLWLGTSDWEAAWAAFSCALHFCDASTTFSSTQRYRGVVLGELGKISRRLGGYREACNHLTSALAGLKLGQERVDLCGELGVVHGRMGMLDEALHIFQNQHDTAKQLDLKGAECQAIGNMAMINYQFSQRDEGAKRLETAIEQQSQCLKRAQHISIALFDGAEQTMEEVDYMRQILSCVSISEARLALCYTAKGDTDEAIKAGRRSVESHADLVYPTVLAFSRLCYGRALIAAGKSAEALEQFNCNDGYCTPPIALCREPSSEYRDYLQELVDIDIDWKRVDGSGYTALDYAVFNGSTEMQRLVLAGLRRQITPQEIDVDETLLRYHTESRLRKGYREVFQYKLIPILRARDATSMLSKLRTVYAESLQANEEWRTLFDKLKFLRYTDFAQLGRLPASNDKLAQTYTPDDGRSDFVVFFSYRWLNKTLGTASPDDIVNTQYRRMIDAAEKLLLKHTDIDRESLCIWLDYACIDQYNPGPGVSALPMILAQCDVMISLIDEEYHSRAWCSIEATTMFNFQASFGVHRWYEHVIPQPESRVCHDAAESFLQGGQVGTDIESSKQHLTFEHDRPKLQFLERQLDFLLWWDGGLTPDGGHDKYDHLA